MSCFLGISLDDPDIAQTRDVVLSLPSFACTACRELVFPLSFLGFVACKRGHVDFEPMPMTCANFRLCQVDIWATYVAGVFETMKRSVSCDASHISQGDTVVGTPLGPLRTQQPDPALGRHAFESDNKPRAQLLRARRIFGRQGWLLRLAACASLWPEASMHRRAYAPLACRGPEVPLASPKSLPLAERLGRGQPLRC